MIPLITLEEHFFSSAIGNPDAYSEQLKWVPGVFEKLQDLGPIRLEHMDKNGVTLQVISHAPGLGAALPEECSSANDQLAAAVSKNKTRFAGFAVLSMAHSVESAVELRRCIKELGFVGALVDNHIDGKHYDDKKFWPVFEAAQELDVPIYLHPTWPSDDIAAHHQGSFPTSAGISMGSSGWGWHSDTGLHVLKLFAAGVFDEYPRLKIIVGHFGEMLPFMLERIMILSKRWGDRQRLFKEVYDNNIWITTSGVWSVSPMACILRNTKIDHILYSVDYPFAKNEDGLQFMEDLKSSGLVDDEQFEKIGYKNAEALLQVKAAH
jgi:predicted TIM-barrel fold metal-dependent hydrolase